MRILIVEDETELREQLQQMLQQGGYAVDTAYDGEEGHFLGDTEPYDVIVLDLGLPKRGGLEVLKALRGRSIDTPVIILTAQGGTDNLVAAFETGADDYVVKPVDLEELCARIRAHQRRSTGRTRASCAATRSRRTSPSASSRSSSSASSRPRT